MSAENKMPVGEMIESLTGFDEIAIAKNFDAEWGDLADTKPVTFTRSLIFVQKRREGLNDPDAKNAALGMTLKEVNAFFEDDIEEVMPEEPESESGKDASQPATQPMNSQPSA